MATIARSLKMWLADWKRLIAWYALDYAFLALFVAVFIGLQVIIVQRIDSVLGMVQEELGRVTGGSFTDSGLVAEYSDQLLAANPAISQLFGEIIVLFAGLIAALMLTYCLFQGAGWAITTKPKKGFFRYLGGFFIINIAWAVLLGVLLYFWFDLTVYNMRSFVPVMGQGLLNTLMMLSIAALGYFAVVSYALLGKSSAWKSLKQAFVTGTEKVLDYLPRYLLGLGAMVVSLAIVYFAWKMSFIGTIVAVSLLFVPTISLMRVLVAGGETGQAAL